MYFYIAPGKKPVKKKMETAKLLIHSVCHSTTFAKNKSNKAAGVSWMSISFRQKKKLY